MAKREDAPKIKGLKEVNSILAGYFSDYIILEDGRTIYGRPINHGSRVKAYCKNDEVAEIYKATYHESALLKSVLAEMKVTKATMKDKVDCIDFKLYDTTDIDHSKPYDKYRIKKIPKNENGITLLPNMKIEPMLDKIMDAMTLQPILSKHLSDAEIAALNNKEFVTIEGVLLGKNELPSIEKANDVRVYTVGTDVDKDDWHEGDPLDLDFCYGSGTFKYIIFEISFDSVRITKMLQYGFTVKSI